MFKILLRTALIVALTPAPAWAISCGGARSIREAFSGSGHVFLAHVEALYRGPGFRQAEVSLASLRVLHVWKGDLQPGSTVSTSAQSSVSFYDDGFVPTQHTGLVVYASGEPPLMLHTCSRTGLLQGSINDIPTLNRLAKPARPRDR